MEFFYLKTSEENTDIPVGVCRMISIQSSLTELERSHREMEAVLDCYIAALRNIGQYALELDEALTNQYRLHLISLANAMHRGGADEIASSRATLRGLLRDFRDRSAGYVANLRDELANSARALEEILDALIHNDDDHEQRLRKVLSKLRDVASSASAGTAGTLLAGVADSIEQSIRQMRQHHQLATSQFMAEIRVLHKRIDSLESAASLDELKRVANRGEVNEWIRLAAPGEYCLLLLGIRGLLRAEVQFGKELGEELAAAFVRRLNNSLPPASEVARWSAEEFAAKVPLRKNDAVAMGKGLGEILSGQYVCLQGGKAVKPTVQVTVGVVDTGATESADHILRRVEQFFGGREIDS
jgi:GGDEF domain-containing protein